MALVTCSIFLKLFQMLQLPTTRMLQSIKTVPIKISKTVLDLLYSSLMVTIGNLRTKCLLASLNMFSLAP